MKLNIAERLPLEYNRDFLIALFRQLENQVNALAEGRITARHFTATSAPTTGTFQVGDIVWNTTPAASGTIGWVCVTAGSPGTFKTFGAIAA